MNCTECHSSTTQTNLRRVSTHLSGDAPEQIHLQTDDVFAMADKCRGCHQQEFAQWSSSAHSATYARIFATAEHNRKRLLMDDCLRCHGMHFEGSIANVVQPLDTKGPWKLADPALANRPAIPCLACHAMHREGQPLVKMAERVAGKEEIARPSLGFFDRRSRTNIRMDVLALPVMYDGARPVRISPDNRQALCYQCHAALAATQVGSGDDRTPVGRSRRHQLPGAATRSTARTRGNPVRSAIRGSPTAAWTSRRWTPRSATPRARTTFTR